jgi:hypothetical protein
LCGDHPARLSGISWPPVRRHRANAVEPWRTFSPIRRRLIVRSSAGSNPARACVRAPGTDLDHGRARAASRRRARHCAQTAAKCDALPTPHSVRNRIPALHGLSSRAARRPERCRATTGCCQERCDATGRLRSEVTRDREKAPRCRGLLDAPKRTRTSTRFPDRARNLARLGCPFVGGSRQRPPQCHGGDDTDALERVDAATGVVTALAGPSHVPRELARAYDAPRRTSAVSA